MNPRKAGTGERSSAPAAGGADDPGRALPGLAPRAWRFLSRFVGGRRRAAREPGYDVEGSGVPTTPVSFQQELRVLGLYGRPFGWEEYRDRLAVHLGIEIRVVFVDEDQNAVLHMVLAQEGSPGLVKRDEETGDALVLVLASLDDLARTLVVFHELSHVAGGHPVPTDESAGASPDGGAAEFWDPPMSVLGGPAPRDEDLCERDARLRAELALQAGLFGYDPHRTDESFFLLDGK